MRAIPVSLKNVSFSVGETVRIGRVHSIRSKFIERAFVKTRYVHQIMAAEDDKALLPCICGEIKNNLKKNSQDVEKLEWASL